MSLETKIKLPNSSNAIKEAVISVFLINPIIKPERFKTLIENDFKDKFEQFEPTSTVEFTIQNTSGKIENSGPQYLQNAGFKFSHFKNGSIANIIQGLNEQTRYYLSYHTLQYNRWDNFISECSSCFDSINKLQSDLFVAAISLHYINEFTWVDSSNKMDLKTIFNENATYIPKEFFKSSSTEFLLTTERDENELKYYDRITIKIESKIDPVITISHNVTVTFTNQEVENLKDLISRDEFKRLSTINHESNKKLLKDILTKEILALIKMN